MARRRCRPRPTANRRQAEARQARQTRAEEPPKTDEAPATPQGRGSSASETAKTEAARPKTARPKPPKPTLLKPTPSRPTVTCLSPPSLRAMQPSLPARTSLLARHEHGEVNKPVGEAKSETAKVDAPRENRRQRADAAAARSSPAGHAGVAGCSQRPLAAHLSLPRARRLLRARQPPRLRRRQHPQRLPR